MLASVAAAVAWWADCWWRSAIHRVASRVAIWMKPVHTCKSATRRQSEYSQLSIFRGG